MGHASSLLGVIGKSVKISNENFGGKQSQIKQVTFPWHSAANSHQGRRSKGEEEQISHFLRIRSIPISSQLCIRHRRPFSDRHTDQGPLHVSKFWPNSFSFSSNPIFRIESYYPVIAPPIPAPSPASPAPRSRRRTTSRTPTASPSRRLREFRGLAGLACGIAS